MEKFRLGELSYIIPIFRYDSKQRYCWDRSIVVGSLSLAHDEAVDVNDKRVDVPLTLVKCHVRMYVLYRTYLPYPRG